MSFLKKFIPGKSDEPAKPSNGETQGKGVSSAKLPDPAAKPEAKPSASTGGQTTRMRAIPNAPPDELAARTGSQKQRLVPQEEEARKTVGSAFAPQGEEAGKLRAAPEQPSVPDLAVSPEADMLEILSEQAGLKYIKLGDVPKTWITPELLRMIPAEIARTYTVFPIQYRAEDRTIVVAISDPLNVRIVDDLRLFLMDQNVRDVEAVVANEEEIVDYINLYYGVGDKTLDQMVEEFEAEDTSTGLEQREGTYDLSDIEKIAQEAPIIRFCNLLLLQAIKDRASDLHIEPFSNALRIRYRVDGVLREIPSPPKSWQTGIISRFKVMAGMDISESRRPQDGRIKLTVEGREIDMRVSTLPVAHGEGMAMRILDKNMALLGVQQIGMMPDVLEQFMKVVERPNGIILVTGPTGSGKTTTLYAALNEINSPTEKIITTEDPVEYQLDGLVQVNINPNVGLTFAAALRAILRQDPDIILVGEVRDVETAQIAIQASLTGHLVFSTLHTNSAAGAVTRLIDMGVEPFLITSSLEAVIGQRLVRLICPICKRPYDPLPEELAEFATTREEVADITFFHGEGCAECAETGYKGRIGIFELLRVTDEIRDLILERATTDQIQDTAIRQGMKTMRQDGWLKICLGITTFEEVCKHTPRESRESIRMQMETLLKQTVEEAGGELHTGKPAERPKVGMAEIEKEAAPAGSEPWSGEVGMRARDAGDATQAPLPPTP
ncbi:Type IV fimbrial assembly, ATPase PilB [Candidatus Sumerlaea chitinivorans]|uniref:protein-secreting ATPase n=1 Tax=Sumerlaea chitinivorans TaxID=2250252 RepID=A0A2Z4Y663_SUMC1|nr:Type IV fimbrial assembly, ATPase PilB [Candidatus Sumerlaea chitinivorans]